MHPTYPTSRFRAAPLPADTIHRTPLAIGRAHRLRWQPCVADSKYHEHEIKIQRDRADIAMLEALSSVMAWRRTPHDY
jgi:hypothetical protein